MKREKYLPIGSIILLAEADKKLMITGFAVKGAESEEIYDYIGCLYPEGVVAPDKHVLFNHSQIGEILFIGYENEEETEFKTKLNKFIANKNNEGE